MFDHRGKKGRAVIERGGLLAMTGHCAQPAEHAQLIGLVLAQLEAGKGITTSLGAATLIARLAEQGFTQGHQGPA